MSNRKLETFDEYRYGPRSVLQPGDRFRVSGGPYYVNPDGSKSLYAERGVFVFKRYCTFGSQKWIEARHQDGGDVVLWVGKSVANPDLPTFRRRPYKVRKVGETKRERKKKATEKVRMAAEEPKDSPKRRKVAGRKRKKKKAKS
jgi:hypothetical protein